MLPQFVRRSFWARSRPCPDGAAPVRRSHARLQLERVEQCYEREPISSNRCNETPE